MLCSCGGGSSGSTPPPAGNPVPAVQSFSPSGAAAGANSFTLAINGSNFLSSSTVTWNGAAKQATFVSASQLTIPVLASDLSASATVPVAVSNPSPGGGQASSNFSITAPAAPTVASVTPNAFGAGSGAITATVTGSNFVSNSVVQWNGQSRPTTYVSDTQLTVAIPATDLTTAVASLPVTVMTPNSGSSTSLPVAVVSPALPTISSLTPNQVVLGSPAFTLTVNGTNFVGGATVYWNGISRVTQFVSTTQLTASILAPDLASSPTHSAAVTVQNPTPNAGISAPATFTLDNPTPQITSISPNTTVAGTTATVAISGTGFIAGATVQFGSQVFATTFNSSTSLSANIATTTVGSANLTVSNPAPSAGPSNAVTFSGTAAGQGVQLTVVNVNPAGQIIAGGGVMSSSGRYFGFLDSQYNFYLRDTCLGGPSGCIPSTGSSGALNPPLLDMLALIWVSTDGRYLSYADTNETAGGFFQFANIVDTCLGVSSGCTPGAKVTSLQNTYFAYMAEDGRYLSYGELPTAPNTAQPVTTSIYDTCIGAPPGCTQATIVPTVTTTASAPWIPVPSADGRYLVYENTSGQIVLHDSCLGAAPGCVPSEQVVFDNHQQGLCKAPTISSDAKYLAWSCFFGGSLVGMGYLQATCLGSSTGCSTTPSQITSSVPYGGSVLPSAGGRFTAFLGMINGTSVVYVYDSCNGGPAGCTTQTVPISLNSSGAVANSGAGLWGISDDGKYILFESAATNLVTLPAGVSGAFYIARNPLL